VVTPEQDKQDMLAYMDVLPKRLSKITERAGAIPAGQFGSSEWFKEVGDYWREARENEGLSRYELASKAGVHVNVIRFLEEGMAYPEELRGDLLHLLSLNISGNETQSATFNQRFNVTAIPIKVPRFRFLPSFISSKWISMSETS